MYKVHGHEHVFICLCLLCLFLHNKMLPFWNMFSISYFTMLFFYLFFIMYDSDYFTWNFNITGNKRSRFCFHLDTLQLIETALFLKHFTTMNLIVVLWNRRFISSKRRKFIKSSPVKMAHSLNCFQIFFFLFSECVPFCISTIITRAVEDIQLMWMRIYFSQTDKMYLFMKAKGKKIK